MVPFLNFEKYIFLFYHHLEIVKVKDEESEKQSGVMILKSKKDSSENDVEERLTSKAMVTFSTEELEYLKIIVQHILLSDTKEITSTFAVNRISDMKNSRKMTVQQAEVILHKFKEHYWLKFDDSNPNIRMTPRFINEMGTFLEKMYKKLNPDDDKCSQIKCGICNELVFQVRNTEYLLHTYYLIAGVFLYQQFRPISNRIMKRFHLSAVILILFVM